MSFSTRSPFFNLLISVFSEFENFSTVMRNFLGCLILASIYLILSSIFTTSFCKSTMSFLSLSLTAFGESLSSSAYFFGKIVYLALFLRFVAQKLVFFDGQVLHFLFRVFGHIIYECWEIVFVADSVKLFVELIHDYVHANIVLRTRAGFVVATDVVCSVDLWKSLKSAINARNVAKNILVIQLCRA